MWELKSLVGYRRYLRSFILRSMAVEKSRLIHHMERRLGRELTAAEKRLMSLAEDISKQTRRKTTSGKLLLPQPWTSTSVNLLGLAFARPFSSRADRVNINPTRGPMPSVVKIDPRRKIVLSTFHGDVTGEDVLRHRMTIASDAAFAPDYVDLVDFSSVALATVDECSLRALANQASLFHANAVHIIVVPAGDAYMMALRFKEIAARSRGNIYVVRSMEEARELLKSMGCEF